MNCMGLVLKERLLKQKWLAEQLGITSVMVNLYVLYKKQTKLDTLMKIAQLLDFDIEKLIDKKTTE
jgi:putative transcriptional regulator